MRLGVRLWVSYGLISGGGIHSRDDETEAPSLRRG